jgi:hypothetical protein
MEETLRKYLLVTVTLILLASGCATTNTPTHSLTVIFDKNQCAYNGARSVASGDVGFTMINKNKDLDAAMIVLTLDNGKTNEDLKALPPNQGEDPLWSHRVGEAQSHVHPGEKNTFKATIEAGPIYLICFSGSPELITGVLGPFEVIK